MTENNNNIEDKKDRLVVYTALFGDYDDLIDPPKKFEGCDFVCFTDQKLLKSDLWEIRLVEDCDLPPNMMNRRYKILPHLFFPEYERSLYVDANIKLLNNPFNLVNKYLGKSLFSAPKHPWRNCIYQEARECIYLKKERYESIAPQIKKYRESGMPENFGLTENNVLIRFHNDLKVIALMISWWDEINVGAKRDQLSLPYVLFKHEFDISLIEESSRSKNAYLIALQHKIKKSFILQKLTTLDYLFRKKILSRFGLWPL